MELAYILVEAPIDIFLDFPHTWGNDGPRLSFASVPLTSYLTCTGSKASEGVCILLRFCDIHPV
jgi:hypothetical protein